MQTPIIGTICEERFSLHLQGFIGWAENHQLPVTAIMLESLSEQKTGGIRTGLEVLLAGTNSRYDRDLVLHAVDSNRSVALLKCSASYAVELFDRFLSSLNNPEVAAYIQEYAPVPGAPEPRKSFWRRVRELAMPEKQECIVTYSSEAGRLYQMLSRGIDSCKARLGSCMMTLSGRGDSPAKAEYAEAN